MKKRFAKWCATALVSIAGFGMAEAVPMNSLTVVVPRVDIAAVGQSQTDPDLIVWQTYDSFSGPGLNTGLWQSDGHSGGLSTGAGGLTLTPWALSGPGDTDIGIRATLPVNLGAFFAVRVPFQITEATADISGSMVDFNINLCGVDQHPAPCDSVGWALANNIVPPTGGSPISGNVFHADDETTLTLQTTVVSAGELALIYSAGLITNYINDGSGWQQLGASFFPPAAWTPSSVPLTLVVSSGITVNVPQSQVPEPTSLALLGLGLGLSLAGLGFGRRRTR